MDDSFAREIRDRKRPASEVVERELIAHVAQREIANGSCHVAERSLHRVPNDGNAKGAPEIHGKADGDVIVSPSSAIRIEAIELRPCGQQPSHLAERELERADGTVLNGRATQPLLEPTLDVRNATAQLGTELALSALGLKIL